MGMGQRVGPWSLHAGRSRAPLSGSCLSRFAERCETEDKSPAREHLLPRRMSRSGAIFWANHEPPFALPDEHQCSQVLLTSVPYRGRQQSGFGRPPPEGWFCPRNPTFYGDCAECGNSCMPAHRATSKLLITFKCIVPRVISRGNPTVLMNGFLRSETR